MNTVIKENWTWLTISLIMLLWWCRFLWQLW